MSRGRFGGIVIAIAVLSAVVGWVASSRIQSRAEVAARTAAPQPSPILVPAEARALSTDVVTRGKARFGSPQQLSIPPTALKSQVAIVSELPLLGAEVGEGDVVLIASGRPVFLLAGDHPSFRDLGPGVQGEDVRQLEAALDRMGFAPGAVDGVYDHDTEAAVAQWYRSEGFDPFEASAEQLAAIRALQGEVVGAQIDVLDADSAIAAAEAELAVARGAHESALLASRRGPEGFAAAQAAAAAANRAAAAEVATKQAALDTLLAGPAPTPVSAREIATAQAELAAAQANAEVTRISGEQAIAEAQATGTPADVANALALAQAANQAAAAEVAVKQVALSALQSGPATVPPNRRRDRQRAG